MRLGLGILIALLASGCGSVPDDSSGDQARDHAPGINVTAAPGVAFRYAYTFRAPAPRISAVQEAHAAACERLGIARCRITAMRYARNSDNRIDASLGFRLAPELARAFGRDGIKAIEAAEGMVLTAQIDGDDAGARIEQLAGERETAATERVTIDSRTVGTTGEARAELERQRADSVAAARRADVGVAAQRAALAATPVTFAYVSGQAVRSFDAASPLTYAADLAIASARWTFGTTLALLGVALPPLMLALFGFWAWSRFARAWHARRARPA